MNKAGIQSIVFEKRLFSAAKARKWLSSNGLAADLTESGTTYRATIRPLDAFKANTIATNSPDKGVQIVTGTAKEAAASGANSQLLKASVSEQATIAAVKAGVFEVVLISEGLGNRGSMHYYGPEAIQSAPAVFEGRPCFLNHPSLTEEEDIPERRVESQCGFFKNCRVEKQADGKLACVGELHLESTPQGEYARKKCDFALLYKREFPQSPEEYCGLSVAAAGEVEPRQMAVDGQQESVNYLNRFTAAMSCDLVTTPARGGKILQLMESRRNLNSKEAKNLMDEAMKQIQDEIAALDSALAADEKADAGVKAKVAVLKKLISGMAAPKEEAAPAPAADPAAVPPADKPVEAAPVTSADAPIAPVDAPPAQPAAAPEAQPAPVPAAPAAPVQEPCKGAGAPMPAAAPVPLVKDDEADEANRLAIQFILKEAGDDIAKVIGADIPKTIKEARAKISDIKKVMDVVKEAGIPSGLPAKGEQIQQYEQKL